MRPCLSSQSFRITLHVSSASRRHLLSQLATPPSENSICFGLPWHGAHLDFFLRFCPLSQSLSRVPLAPTNLTGFSETLCMLTNSILPNSSPTEPGLSEFQTRLPQMSDDISLWKYSRHLKVNIPTGIISTDLARDHALPLLNTPVSLSILLKTKCRFPYKGSISSTASLATLSQHWLVSRFCLMVFLCLQGSSPHTTPRSPTSLLFIRVTSLVLESQLKCYFLRHNFPHHHILSGCTHRFSF